MAVVSLSQFVQPEEQESDNDECCGEDTDPHKNAGNTLRIKIDKEVRVDKGGGGRRNQNRGVKLQNDRLNQQEDHISKGEGDGNEGIIPLALFALVEQEPVCNVHDGQHHMGQKAADAPVCLRITACSACEHNVKDEEGQKNSKHTDKLQKGGGRNIAVLFLLCGLNQRSEHYADAQEIADVGEVNVEIPTNYIDVIEDSQTCDTSHKAQGAIDGLKNQLCRSVFDHNKLLHFLNR